MDKDGVVIRGVTEADEGIFSCRVRVVAMGTIEERHIQLEVFAYLQADIGSFSYYVIYHIFLLRSTNFR